jgi:hypothetical protein
MLLLGLMSEVAFAAEAFTRLRADERIAFYPGLAQRVPGTDRWRAEIRGVVFEPERARTSVAVFQKAVQLQAGELTTAERELFAARARLFLVDHERRKRVFIRIGTNEFFVGKSGADGVFSGSIEFSDAARRGRGVMGTADCAGLASSIPFTAVLPADDTREFCGEVFSLSAEGVSVVSDLDDTIKITEVRDRQAVLRNTFLREFAAVPGMAEFYQRLASSNQAAFHYVSASPWQLYEPLHEFVRTNGFPAGTFHLKPFRWKDGSFFSLFADPVKYKRTVIEPLFNRFPDRKFILIGDSGERDPEIYGELARRFPRQVDRIYIRDVTMEDQQSSRYGAAFRAVPPERWRVFRHPGEIGFAPD